MHTVLNEGQGQMRVKVIFCMFVWCIGTLQLLPRQNIRKYMQSHAILLTSTKKFTQDRWKRQRNISLFYLLYFKWQKWVLVAHCCGEMKDYCGRNRWKFPGTLEVKSVLAVILHGRIVQCVRGSIK